ncbi:cupredoxin domain-containing protein [Candidatus Daviesbacteria bacterium]|nr:cupredoxin domain-containing protein [Candidatus Daviesbacteria bacterium]
MPKNVVIATVVIVVLVLAGWYFIGSKKYSTPQAPAKVSQTPAPVAASPTSSATDGAIVTEDKNAVQISSSGFSPKSIAIKVGETVTWMNNDNTNHTVYSAGHPTHLTYPPLNLGTIKPGRQVSLEFPKAGTYQYHDHLNPSLTGSVTVK